MFHQVWGFTEPFALALASLDDCSLSPARVLSARRGHYRLVTERGVLTGVLAGRLRHACGPGALPLVGDWLAVRLIAGEARATIVACLPRRTLLVRRRPDGVPLPQGIAANLDVVFVVTSLNRDFSPRRIERMLALVRESGAAPVVLLTKADLCDARADYLAEAEGVARGVPIHALSAITGDGLAALAPYLVEGRTVGLIGSSGVGKSTLVNVLLGDAAHTATGAIREADDRGRHTTTARELFALPRGGLLLDTPGMREVGLWDADEGLAETFDDVEAWLARCRFGDCAHRGEPGCALAEALRTGALSPARYASYEKLQRELAHEAQRVDASAAHVRRREERRVHRMHTRVQRASPKR